MLTLAWATLGIHSSGMIKLHPLVKKKQDDEAADITANGYQPEQLEKIEAKEHIDTKIDDDGHTM